MSEVDKENERYKQQAFTWLNISLKDERIFSMNINKLYLKKQKTEKQKKEQERIYPEILTIRVFSGMYFFV